RVYNFLQTTPDFRLRKPKMDGGRVRFPWSCYPPENDPLPFACLYTPLWPGGTETSTGASFTKRPFACTNFGNCNAVLSPLIVRMNGHMQGVQQDNSWQCPFCGQVNPYDYDPAINELLVRYGSLSSDANLKFAAATAIAETNEYELQVVARQQSKPFLGRLSSRPRGPQEQQQGQMQHVHRIVFVIDTSAFPVAKNQSRKLHVDLEEKTFFKELQQKCGRFFHDLVHSKSVLNRVEVDGGVDTEEEDDDSEDEDAPASHHYELALVTFGSAVKVWEMLRTYGGASNFSHIKEEAEAVRDVGTTAAKNHFYNTTDTDRHGTARGYEDEEKGTRSRPRPDHAVDTTPTAPIFPACHLIRGDKDLELSDKNVLPANAQPFLSCRGKNDEDAAAEHEDAGFGSATSSLTRPVLTRFLEHALKPDKSDGAGGAVTTLRCTGTALQVAEELLLLGSAAETASSGSRQAAKTSTGTSSGRVILLTRGPCTVGPGGAGRRRREPRISVSPAEGTRTRKSSPIKSKDNITYDVYGLDNAAADSSGATTTASSDLDFFGLESLRPFVDATGGVLSLQQDLTAWVATVRKMLLLDGRPGSTTISAGSDARVTRTPRTAYDEADEDEFGEDNSSIGLDAKMEVLCTRRIFTKEPIGGHDHGGVTSSVGRSMISSRSRGRDSSDDPQLLGQQMQEVEESSFHAAQLLQGGLLNFANDGQEAESKLLGCNKEQQLQLERLWRTTTTGRTDQLQHAATNVDLVLARATAASQTANFSTSFQYRRLGTLLPTTTFCFLVNKNEKENFYPGAPRELVLQFQTVFYARRASRSGDAPSLKSPVSRRRKQPPSAYRKKLLVTTVLLRSSPAPRAPGVPFSGTTSLLQSGKMVTKKMNLHQMRAQFFDVETAVTVLVKLAVEKFLKLGQQKKTSTNMLRDAAQRVATETADSTGEQHPPSHADYSELPGFSVQKWLFQTVMRFRNQYERKELPTTLDGGTSRPGVEDDSDLAAATTRASDAILNKFLFHALQVFGAKAVSEGSSESDTFAVKLSHLRRECLAHVLLLVKPVCYEYIANAGAASGRLAENYPINGRVVSLEKLRRHLELQQAPATNTSLEMTGSAHSHQDEYEASISKRLGSRVQSQKSSTEAASCYLLDSFSSLTLFPSAALTRDLTELDLVPANSHRNQTSRSTTSTTSFQLQKSQNLQAMVKDVQDSVRNIVQLRNPTPGLITRNALVGSKTSSSSDFSTSALVLDGDKMFLPVALLDAWFEELFSGESHDHNAASKRNSNVFHLRSSIQSATEFEEYLAKKGIRISSRRCQLRSENDFARHNF
ncbi:unnamed protein product, partial [Amoebophrya sp. A120]